MKDWQDTYERLIGRPPTKAQVARINGIRAILRIRDDDAFWYILVVNDFYVHLVSASIQRLKALREEWEQQRQPSGTTWADVRRLARQPLAFAAIVGVALTLVGSNALTAVAVGFSAHGGDDRHVGEILARQAELDRSVQRLLESMRTGAAAEHATSSSEYGLLEALHALPPADRQRFEADPALLVRSLRVLASLGPEALQAFDQGGDPAGQQGTTRQAALAWFVRRFMQGEPGASRLIAAYAAEAPALLTLLKRLPVACNLATYTQCRQ